VSKQKDKIGSGDILRPQVIVVEEPEKPGAGIADPLAPRIIKTAQTGRIIPGPPALRFVDEARCGRSTPCLLRLARR
jgi:hypothetical protein